MDFKALFALCVCVCVCVCAAVDMVPFAGISDNAKVQEYWKALKVSL